MDNAYEYRLGSRHRTPGLVAIALAALISFTVRNQTPVIFATIVGLCAIFILWMLMRHEVAGVRVDSHFLTLAAWREPLQIPLPEIDHLRMTDWTDDGGLIVVYTNGEEQEIPSGDLPSIQLFSEVMADRGITIKDPRP